MNTNRKVSYTGKVTDRLVPQQPGVLTLNCTMYAKVTGSFTAVARPLAPLKEGHTLGKTSGVDLLLSLFNGLDADAAAGLGSEPLADP